MTSATGFGSMAGTPSRSATVRATFRIRSWARAVRPCWFMPNSLREFEDKQLEAAFAVSPHRHEWNSCLLDYFFTLSLGSISRRCLRSRGADPPGLSCLGPPATHRNHDRIFHRKRADFANHRCRAGSDPTMNDAEDWRSRVPLRSGPRFP